MTQNTAAGRTVRAKDLKWLEAIRLASDGSGMYPGLPADMVPAKSAHNLNVAGLILTFIPRNPYHKERWKISQEGRAALTSAKAVS